MKTKEEIEQLAKEEYKDNLHNPFFTAAPMGYIKGYTQCQEDMADKSKQETLEEAAEKYINTKNPQWTPYHRKSFEDGAKWQQTNSDKKYTEEDIIKAIEKARDIFDGKDCFTAEDVSGCTEVCTYNWKFQFSEDDIINSLNKQDNE